MKKAKFWLFAASLIPFVLFSQASWGGRYYRAFLVPHNQDMTDMMQPVNGLEFNRAWRIDSGGNVDLRQHHPIAGFGLHYFQLNNDISGNTFGFQAFYEAGVKITAKLSLRARLSVGVGYLTKQFNVYTNPTNRAIGSNINGFMQVQGYFETPLSKLYDMQLGLGMSHYSNGNWSMPNLGINLPGLVLGVKRRDANTRYVHLKSNRLNRVFWELGFRAGKRQMSIDDPRNIAMYMAELSFNYPHNDIRGWRGGVNVYFDRSYMFEKFQTLPKPQLGRITEIAITGGHEYRINRLGFVTDLGIYLYRPDRSKRMYYEAVGMKLYLTENLIIMNRLKAHLTSADYFEFGMSYTFGKQVSSPGLGNCFKWLLGGLRAQE